jgi:hypothetical protein
VRKIEHEHLADVETSQLKRYLFARKNKMAYQVNIKIIVPQRFYHDAIAMCENEGFKTLEDLFNIMTGLVNEAVARSRANARVHVDVEYNKPNSRAGGYIYKMCAETDVEANFYPLFENADFIRLLELLSPCIAHGSIIIEKNGKKVGDYEIGFGHSHRVYIRKGTNASTVTSAGASESSKRKATNEPGASLSNTELSRYAKDVGAPKKSRLTIDTREASINRLAIDTLNLGPKCAIEYEDSLLIMSIIVPPKKMDAAIRVVQEKGYGTVESYFNALSHMLVCSKKETRYNEVSRKNGAYIFITTLRANYDNFVYIFNSKVKKAFELISPYCNNNTMNVMTPIENVDGSINYEMSPLYKLKVGEDGFECYMGEEGWTSSNSSSVKQSYEEEEYSNPVVNADIFAEADERPTSLHNVEPGLVERPTSPALEIFKNENKDLINKIHARYEELLVKMEDLQQQRTNYNIEIEITRRIIRELEELTI